MEPSTELPFRSRPGDQTANGVPAGRHGEDAAADPALCRQADPESEGARGVIIAQVSMSTLMRRARSEEMTETSLPGSRPEKAR